MTIERIEISAADMGRDLLADLTALSRLPLPGAVARVAITACKRALLAENRDAQADLIRQLLGAVGRIATADGTHRSSDPADVKALADAVEQLRPLHDQRGGVLTRIARMVGVEPDASGTVRVAEAVESLRKDRDWLRAVVDETAAVLLQDGDDTSCLPEAARDLLADHDRLKGEVSALRERDHGKEINESGDRAEAEIRRLLGILARLDEQLRNAHADYRDQGHDAAGKIDALKVAVAHWRAECEALAAGNAAIRKELAESAPADSQEVKADPFYDLLNELRELHDRKAADYGAEDDQLANVRGSEDFNVPAWVGAVLRGNDKMVRLKTFARRGWLANESVEDSLKDLAVYCLIALQLFREGQQASGGPASEDCGFPSVGVDEVLPAAEDLSLLDDAA